MFIRSADKNKAIEIRLEGKSIVIGNLVRGAQMYDSSIILTPSEAVDVLEVLQHYVDSGKLPEKKSTTVAFRRQ